VIAPITLIYLTFKAYASEAADLNRYLGSPGFGFAPISGRSAATNAGTNVDKPCLKFLF